MLERCISCLSIMWTLIPMATGIERAKVLRNRSWPFATQKKILRKGFILSLTGLPNVGFGHWVLPDNAENDQRTCGDDSDFHVIIFDEIDAIC